MKRDIIAVLFFLVSLTVASCSKFSNGEPVTEQRNIGKRFEVLCMYNNVNVNLKHSSHPHLELTCPKNLIDNIFTEVVGDSLVIRNDNDFNWIRSYNYTIDLTVYYDSLREINFASTARLIGLDTLRGMSMLDSLETTVHGFTLRVTEGCGDIDLTLNCDVLYDRFTNGTSSIVLHGQTAYSEHDLQSYGTINAMGLNSNFVRVQSRSTNDVYVFVRNGGGLRTKIYSIGNIYYKGNPAPHYTSHESYGEGQLIKLE
jgi:hypothetical protein